MCICILFAINGNSTTQSGLIKKVSMKLFLTIPAVIIFFCSSTVTADTRLKEVQFKDPWIRTTSSGHPMTAGYLSILNNGSADVELVRVSSSIAEKVELHETTFHNNIMKMKQLESGVRIPAQGVIHFSPKGLHLMFKGLKMKVKEGGKYKVNLKFKNGGKAEIIMIGRKIGSKGAHKHHKH